MLRRKSRPNGQNALSETEQGLETVVLDLFSRQGTFFTAIRVHWLCSSSRQLHDPAE
jgi:hypothetical protein